jgi:lipoprotein NlpD
MTPFVWRNRPALALVLGAAVAGGCSTPRAPVDARGEDRSPQTAVRTAPAAVAPAPIPPSHTVVRGDTLYSIAWRYGLDYRDVAAWNSVGEPYLIRPGQTLRLRAPAVPAVAPRTPATVPPAARLPAPDRSPVARSVTPVPRAGTDSIPWRWPTRGRIVRSESPTSKKGLDIAGEHGQPIHAAAPGAVVYSGSGLLGYGRLIILKHSDTFLSAYAYNEQLLVAEGDRVTAGQQIATMGTGTSGQPMLHFEIRRDGKPVNPLDHLPGDPR